MAKITTVIDIGSNSARMAVYKKSSRFAFSLIKEIKSKVRISEGSYEDGTLQEFAIERAIKALKEFLFISKSLKSRKILCVATSAVRDAKNKNYFINKVKKEIGINIKVIDGNKEAFFGGIAALNLLPYDDLVTIDIGGGSTELALIKNKKIVDTISLNLGTVRLKELFFDKKANIKDIKKFISNEISKIPSTFKGYKVVGIGGTIRALSKAIMQKNKYPLDIIHGFKYSFKKEKDFFEKIIFSNINELKKYHIKEDRYDVIREGTLIFNEILELLEVEDIIASGVGVREGVFLSDLLRNSNYKFPSNFNVSVRNLMDIYEVDRKQAAYEVSLANKLFDILKPLHNLDENYKMHLKYAVKLSEIGKVINFYSSHKHTEYILLHSLNYGFEHKDRMLISHIIRYHKKKKLQKVSYEDLLPNKHILRWLYNMLYVTKILNVNLSNAKIDFELKNNILYISHPYSYLAQEKLDTTKLLFDIKFV